VDIAEDDPVRLLAAAKLRLAWLRERYGPDDIDVLTFAPLVQMIEPIWGCPCGGLTGFDHKDGHGS
jgi:hypothetical protein